MRKQLAERDLQVLRRSQNGETNTVLAEEFGVSRQRIRQIVKKFGVGPKETPAPWSEALSQKAQALRTEGLSLSEIAHQLGTTRHAVCGHLRRRKAPYVTKPQRNDAISRGQRKRFAALGDVPRNNGKFKAWANHT